MKSIFSLTGIANLSWRMFLLWTCWIGSLVCYNNIVHRSRSPQACMPPYSAKLFELRANIRRYSIPKIPRVWSLKAEKQWLPILKSLVWVGWSNPRPPTLDRRVSTILRDHRGCDKKWKDRRTKWLKVIPIHVTYNGMSNFKAKDVLESSMSLVASQ